MNRLSLRLNGSSASKYAPVGAVLVAGTSFLLALSAYYATGFVTFRPYLYNADQLAFPAIYDELVAGRGLAQWGWGPVLYAFPEAILFFLMRWLGGNLHVGIVLFGLSQLLAFSLGLFALARQSANAPRMEHLLAILSSGALFFTTLRYLFTSAQWYMAEQSHFGVMVVWPYALALALALLKLPTLRSGRAVMHATLLALLVLLTTFSDWFAVIQVSVPVIGASFVLLVLKKVQLRPVLAVTILVVAMSTAGCLLFLATPAGRVFLSYARRRASGEGGFVAMVEVLRSLTARHPLHAVLIVAFAGLCGVVVIIEIRKLIRSRQTSACYTAFFATAFLIILAVNPLAVGFAHIFKNAYEMRYLLPLVILPAWWGWPLVLFFFVSLRRPHLVTFVCVGLCAALAVPNVATLRARPMVAIDDYYPDKAQCLDQNATRLGLQDKFGQAGFSLAKTITMLSKKNLRIIQSGPTLRPSHWVNHYRWEAEQPQFLVVDLESRDIPPGPVRQTFGEPAAMFVCENWFVMVYNRPSDVAFQRQLKKPVLSDSQARGSSFEKVNDTVEIEAALLPGIVGHVDGWSRAVASGPPGFLTYGPYVSLPSGLYTFEITYRVESQRGEVGWWDVAVSGQAIKKAALPANQRLVHECFFLPARGQVEVRTFYRGIGRMQVEKLRITRSDGIGRSGRP